MSEAVWRQGGRAVSGSPRPRGSGLDQRQRSAGLAARPPAFPPDRPLCNRCGFAVISRPWGCKNPCPNCGTIYPLGDCSD